MQCPPCMRLLPKLRQVATLIVKDQVNVGTMDCTIHKDLCRDYNIRSYPTTILYNHSIPHDLESHDSVDDIVESVRDVLKPPVIKLNKYTWKTVEQRKNKGYIVDFFAPWCGPCRQFAPEFRRLSKILNNDNVVEAAEVNCDAEKQLCRNNDVRSYPTIRFYPPKSSTYSYIDYSSWNRDSHSIRQWIYKYLPSDVVELRNDNFVESVLKSSDPWLVDFYAPWCGHCHQFAPDFEIIAKKLNEIGIKCGKVDCESYHNLCQQIGIPHYPSVFFWVGKSKNEKKQKYSDRKEMNNLNVDFIVNSISQIVGLDVKSQKKNHEHIDL